MGRRNVAEPELTPFSKFSISDGVFRVTAHSLKIYQEWSNSELHPEKSREFFVSIRGTAVSDKDDIRIIDTDRRSKEFVLFIRSNVEIKETWETVKVREQVADSDKDKSTPERQIRDLQYKILDKLPPTATLLAIDDDRQLDIKGGWSLECEIEQGILERLCTDIADRRVDAINIAIKWSAGLKQENFVQLLGATWGMFSINGRPVPLRGHVSCIGWGLTAEAVQPKHPSSDALFDACLNWTDSFDRRRKEQREPWMDRCAFSLNDQAEIIRRWCDEHGETVSRFGGMMDRAQRLTEDLDLVLHGKYGPFADERWFLWKHKNIVELYRNTKRSQREYYLANFGITSDNTVLQYLRTPWLQTSYLDWLILDAMTCAKIVSTMEAYMNEKHGLVYLLAGRAGWRLFICKVALLPLRFVFYFVVLPAIGWYYLAPFSARLH
jgi:hypothetical protein